MLCNGPLSGQLTYVPEEMIEYNFFQREDGSILSELHHNEAIMAKKRSYFKSLYKFGNNEIFLWEESVK